MKNLNTTLLLLAFITIASYSVSAQNRNNSQWRGEKRDGVYNETGLLKEWNENGPDLLWKYDGLGEGHNSAAVTKSKIYITGLHDRQGKLFVFDLNGKLLKEKVYATEWSKNFEGPRSTITVDDGLLYLYSGFGEFICLNAETLEKVWQTNVLSHHAGENITWGVTESPLIVDDKVIITPGGKANNVVAFDKKNGNVIWRSKALGEKSGYCSPLLIEEYDFPLMVTVTEHSLIALNANTGELMWSHRHTSDYGIQANTPLYAGDGLIFFSNTNGSLMLRIKNNGRSVEKLWETPEFNNFMGGFVIVGDYIYGAGDKRNPWLCLNKNTGKVAYSSRVITSPGNIILADGMLYCYSDRGDLALVKPTPEKFDVVSRFKVRYGTRQHWAHPVIKNGILYIRHGNSLMAYKLK